MGSQKPRVTLRREIHAAQQVLAARVGAQPVELGIGFDRRQVGVALVVDPLQVKSIPRV